MSVLKDHDPEIFAAITAEEHRQRDELELIARDSGDTSIVVSATPSLNTVRFYQALGYEPVAEPLPELYELEPEDVHMQKSL